MIKVTLQGKLEWAGADEFGVIQVAGELLLVTLENCRTDLPTWFAELIRWHEPNGL